MLQKVLKFVQRMSKSCVKFVQILNLFGEDFKGMLKQ